MFINMTGFGLQSPACFLSPQHPLAQKPTHARVHTLLGAGPFIFGGDGLWTEKSLYDGKPSFTYVDDRPNTGMFT